MALSVYAVVLAAGMSARMGSPKQLLPFGSKTVLQRIIDTLLESGLDGIEVVLGHQAEEVRKSLVGRQVDFCLNRNYEKGMFSSLLCGISAIRSLADGALIVLGDQPQIEEKVVRQLVSAFREKQKGILVPVFKGHRGHPALIDLRMYGEEIFQLSGENGIKPLMRGYPENTLELEVEEEWILRDIDTPEVYRSELKKDQERWGSESGPGRPNEL